MKISELKKKSKKDLHNLLKEKRELLRESRFNLVSGKLENYRAIRQTKKDIARILTFLHETERNRT